MTTDVIDRTCAEVELAMEMVKYAQRYGYMSLLSAHRIAMQSVILDEVDKAARPWAEHGVSLDEQELREEDWR